MEHDCELARRMEGLLFDKKSSDMSFIVNGEIIPAHRAIVASSSEYFRALLQGEMKESREDKIVMESASLKGFKLLMRYIYTGQLKLHYLDEETVLEILGLAHMYGLLKLEIVLCQHLEKELSLSNFCVIFNKAHALGLEQLLDTCENFMFAQPSEILKSRNFCDLSEAAVCDMLSRDNFCVEEIEIFNAVIQWCKTQTSMTNFSNVLRTIRLPLIDTIDLVTTVESSGMFTTDQLWDAIKEKKCRTAALNFRGFLKNDINHASPECGASKLTTDERGAFVTLEKRREFESEPMPPFPSTINVPRGTGLTVALKESTFINNIAFIFTEESPGCGYHIELAINLKHWVRVIDYWEYQCRGFQNLFFESRAARYIRLTTNRTDVAVNISNLEVNHAAEPFRISCGFPVPRWNIASEESGAFIKGTRFHGEDSEDEEYWEYEEDSEWKSHEIGAGEIEVFLPQPYTVGSMQMLLRSDESQAYLYFVETSMDEKKWKRVAENTDKLCRGRQKITFEEHPVLFIRIVGVASTVGKRFSLSEFECPAPENGPADGDKRESETEAGGSKEA